MPPCLSPGAASRRCTDCGSPCPAIEHHSTCQDSPLPLGCWLAPLLSCLTACFTRHPPSCPTLYSTPPRHQLVMLCPPLVSQVIADLTALRPGDIYKLVAPFMRVYFTFLDSCCHSSARRAWLSQPGGFSPGLLACQAAVFDGTLSPFGPYTEPIHNPETHPFMPAPLVDKASSLGISHWVTQQDDRDIVIYFCRK